nr:MspA family porin [Mycobacterium dioxanotrophicus]
MLNRFATLAAVCMLAPVAVTPLASADPPPPPDPAAPSPTPPPTTTPADTGAVPSSPPESSTPRRLARHRRRIQRNPAPVAPLTTAVSSREYLVGGTFTGNVTGSGKTKLTGGTLEAGAQIGCGIITDETEINPGISFTPGIKIPFTGSASDINAGTGISLQGKVYLKPGTVTIVPIDKKSFKGKGTRVTITGVRIKFDQCAGQSFIRTYSTLTSSTDNTDDVVTYLGVTKAV